MADESRIGQKVVGTQTNITSDVQGPVFSGEFHDKVTINQHPVAPKIIPPQKPMRVPHFTGREKELAALLDDLQPGQVITICGPGGMGKTALAAEAIWQLAPGNDSPQRFPDGIFFHTFYHKPQAAQALEAIARAYGEDPRQDPLEAAKRALAGRHALIVLDGTEACDDLERVLSVTASCGVLITTRRHADAPADFSDLPPLPLDKAVQLLQAWGGEMASDAKTCQSICNLLGCLPLAIFLVGRYMAHKRQLASEYLTWLEKTPLIALDLGERQHQSIPLLMEHSLLQVSEQAQGCLGLTGALAMKPFEPQIIAIALEITTEDANHSLGDLVDFGLLTRPDFRYQITHALAHTYARERLAPPGNALTRLADYYDTFVRKQQEAGLPGYALLDTQLDHILAVQSACNKAGRWNEVRKLTWALDNYLDLQGHWAERRKSAESGISAARASEVRYDEALFLGLLGLAYYQLGEPVKAIEYHEQALKISREIGDRRNEGNWLGCLGLAYDLGEPVKAIEYYEQALKIAREIGDQRNEGNHLGNLGNAYSDLGELFKAIEYYEQALKISRETGDRRGEGNRLGCLGLAYSDLGEPVKAIEYHDQALKIAREIGDRRNEGNWLGSLGNAYKDLGQPVKAIEHYEQALKIAREIGDRRVEGYNLGSLGLAYADLGETSKAIEHYEQALAITREIGDRRNEYAWLGSLGNAYADLGETRKAIEYYELQLVITREIEDKRGEANACWNLGLAYEKAGDFKQAADLMQLCVDFKREIGHPDAEKDAEYLENLRARIEEK